LCAATPSFPRTATRNMLFFGLALMTIGMFEKIVVAD